MTKVVVSGAFGRMGSMICKMVTETEGLELVGGIDIRAGTLFNVEVVHLQRSPPFRLLHATRWHWSSGRQVSLMRSSSRSEKR